MAHRWYLGKHLDTSQWDKDDAEYEYSLAIFDGEGKGRGHLVFTEGELEDLKNGMAGILAGDDARSGAFENE